MGIDPSIIVDQVRNVTKVGSKKNKFMQIYAKLSRAMQIYPNPYKLLAVWDSGFQNPWSIKPLVHLTFPKKPLVHLLKPLVHIFAEFLPQKHPKKISPLRGDFYQKYSLKISLLRGDFTA